MKVDMVNFFLTSLNFDMRHHSNCPFKSAWDIDFYGADERGTFKTEVSDRRRWKCGVQIWARCKED
jgi:hypothetical protein